MLWPGLLGKNKYEFAKTYCGAKSVQKSDGKIYKDFSKGIRLDELNVLLKQTVMIRRSKEHVMLQLPPKRRQIIRLLLKKSDMISAKAVVREMNICASENGVDEGSPLQFDENGDCCDTTIDLSYQELGIAKLSRFLEWLSIHPIISEKVGENVNSHKMIIFAHHHKVLDGIQEFICEKGTGYVRIDGKTNARDRQEAVHMFQSSREVKIAIIGIMAGGVGLNLSAAQNVAFLELPKNPNLLLQAEDRAHRRGQTNAVNIYIFCAKDTLDEPHWRYLNKSLYFVSSTTNGKYGAIQEIAVEHVSYLGTTQKSNVRSQDQFLDAGMTTIQRMETGISQHMENAQDEKNEEQNEGGVRSSQIENFKNESDSISSPTTKMETMDVERIVGDAKSSLQIESLRFEVSQYTGRIHLYSCVKGKDIRPRPLFENFRLEELESVISFSLGHTKKGHNCIKDNPEFRNALLAFINEWKHLRPIEQKKLLGKPLQLPLTVELCCLSENTHHTKEGLLKCGSKRRKTPLFEISHPLPPNAIWKRVSLCSFNGKKAKEYSQGWTLMAEPLCKLCQNPCQNNNATTPYFLEDLFCNLSCYEEYRARTSARFLRDELFQIEHGVCRNCKLDCHKLVKHIRPLSLENRQKYIKEVAPEIGRRKKLLHKIVHDPTEKNTWHADHIIPVYRGGGECRLENMRTLCVACHADVTAAQCAERCSKRKEAKKKLEILISGLSNGQNIEQNHAKLKDDDISEDELLIKVPGSAYS